MTSARLDLLLNAWLDDVMTDAEQAEFEACLLQDEAARRRFWQLAILHGITWEAAKLRWGLPEDSILNPIGASMPAPSDDLGNAAEGGGPTAGATAPGGLIPLLASRLGPLNSTSPGVLGAIVIASLGVYFGSLFLAVLWQQAWQAKQDPRLVAPKATAPPSRTTAPEVVARLVDADQCHWEKNSFAPVVGANLQRGRLNLLAGVAEVEFGSGARVRFSGPTTLELRSTSLGNLREGRLSARVPPAARGFTIETPTARLIDLGTSFVVEVNHDAQTMMAVTEGVVAVVPAEPSQGGKTSFLDAGQGRRLIAGQAMKFVRTTAGAVLSKPERFDSEWLTRTAPLGGFAPPPAGDAGGFYSRSVMDTPGLVAYWRLGETRGPIARDEVGLHLSPDGIVPGVYHNMRVDDFAQPGALARGAAANDRNNSVRLGGGYIGVRDGSGRLVGDWDGLTVAAWIKPASVNSPDFRMIAGAWTQDAARDQFAMLQSGDGIVISVGDGKHQEPGLRSAGGRPLLAAQWAFAVVAWNKATREYHLYVNGQEDTPAANNRQAGNGVNTSGTALFCIGSESGNARFFDGLIDEVAMFRRCLSTGEIHGLFRAGSKTLGEAAPTAAGGGK